MALNTNTVKISEVKTALGETSNSLITLCKSDKVNRFSATKPFNYQSDGFSTYSELLTASRQSNYGLQLNQSNSISSALTLASGTTVIWPRYKPSGTQAFPCRLGDFRGYNHAAPIPYSSAVTSNPGLVDYFNASFEVDVNKASNAEILVEQMPLLQSGKWVMLWRKSGGSAFEVTGSNVSSTIFPFTLAETSISSEGTYEVCAAIFANGFYYVVPNTYKTFQVTMETSAANYFKMWCAVSSFLVQVDNTHYRIYTRMEVSNGNSTAQNTSWSFSVEDMVNGNTYNYTSNSVTSVPAGGSVIFTPGQSVITTNIGDGSGRVAWGVIEVVSSDDDGLVASDFNIFGWYSRGANHINFSTQMEQIA